MLSFGKRPPGLLAVLLALAVLAGCQDNAVTSSPAAPSEPPQAATRPRPGPTPPSPSPTPPSPAPSPTASSPCAIVGGAPSRGAIVSGTACSSANSSVVLVNVRNAAGAVAFTCSGTVIGSRAVLTAGHCLAGAAAADVDLDGQNVAGASLNVVPGFHAGDLTSLDVAVLLTSQDLARPALPVLVSRAAAIGEQAVVAGWGLDGSGAGGTLRAGYSAISAVGPNYLQTQFVPGSNGSGLCNGDSGAPLLVLTGAWTVAGVGSSITGSCTAAGTDSFANVRNPDIAAFITSLVPDVARR